MRKPARRKCAQCREWFHPAREGQVVCSFDCASAIGKKQTAKAREAAKARAVKRQRESEKEGASVAALSVSHSRQRLNGIKRLSQPLTGTFAFVMKVSPASAAEARLSARATT